MLVVRGGILLARANDRLNLLKRNNQAQITMGVLKYGPISRAHLAKMTGLSITSVCRIADDLISEGVLVETGMGCGVRGRPMILLGVNPDGNPIAGVWLGSDCVEMVVAGPTGRILARRTVQYDIMGLDAATSVALIAQQIQRCAASADKDVSSLRGVGVSVSGMVDPVSGTILSMPSRRFWEGVSVSRMLSEQLDMPVFADNDVRAGALASGWLSDDGHDEDTLFVAVADGISAAIVHGREILAGAHNSAGQIGHMVLDPNGPVCSCGNCGCLSALASDYAFLREIWPEKAEEIVKMSLEKRRLMLKEGYRQALLCEERANQAMLTVTRYLGIGIANAIAALDPRTVFVSGALIDAAPAVVIDLIRREAMNHLMAHVRGVEIQALTNYEEFMLAGCAALVLWQPFKDLQRENRFVQSVNKPDITGHTRVVRSEAVTGAR